MKWFSRSYWWNLLMGDSKEKAVPVDIKRGRPKGSKNKPKTKVRKKK